jgi:hypothetical protein
VLAASERSGIVMGLAKRGTERYGRFYLKGEAEITWEADESIARSRRRTVMHRHARKAHVRR